MINELRCGLYRHYKGGYYQVLGIGEHTETNEKVVVYISLDATQTGPRIRVRPLEGKEGFTTRVGYKGTSKDRFVYIGNEI